MVCVASGRVINSKMPRSCSFQEGGQSLMALVQRLQKLGRRCVWEKSEIQDVNVKRLLVQSHEFDRLWVSLRTNPDMLTRPVVKEPLEDAHTALGQSHSSQLNLRRDQSPSSAFAKTTSQNDTGDHCPFSPLLTLLHFSRSFFCLTALQTRAPPAFISDVLL